MNRIITEGCVSYQKDMPLPRHIGEVVCDYFLHGENPLAIAYRRRKGQEECGTVINSKLARKGTENISLLQIVKLCYL